MAFKIIYRASSWVRDRGESCQQCLETRAKIRTRT